MITEIIHGFESSLVITKDFNLEYNSNLIISSWEWEERLLATYRAIARLVINYAAPIWHIAVICLERIRLLGTSKEGFYNTSTKYRNT